MRDEIETLLADAQRGWKGLHCSREFADRLQAILDADDAARPIPMILCCPDCGAQHVDTPDIGIGWTNPPHKSHLCSQCGAVWRAADVPTVGVAAIQTRGANDTWPPLLAQIEEARDE